MGDITKIQLIHDVKETFDVDDKHLSELISQIENNEFKDNLERFFRGYKTEDIYSHIQGALPWVTLVHGLQQNQFPPLSKEKYQVPDYLCIFENAKKNEIPVLIEVKSVNGDKKSIEIMKRQINALRSYASCMDLPIIIAIYWEKYGFWTHVPIDVFEEKTKKYKITMEDAYKSDVSPIFGDVSFIVNQPIYRKTTYGDANGENPVHEKYGCVLSDSISSDGTNYVDISQIDSAIVDALINMKVESEKKDQGETIVIEKSNNNYVVKLSNWVIRHLGVFRVEPSFKNADISRRLIIELMKKINIPISHGIPAIASSTTNHLYDVAFSGTFVLGNYKSVHDVKNV
jgi:Holliday junction resolvase